MNDEWKKKQIIRMVIAKCLNYIIINPYIVWYHIPVPDSVRRHVQNKTGVLWQFYKLCNYSMIKYTEAKYNSGGSIEQIVIWLMIKDYD